MACLPPKEECEDRSKKASMYVVHGIQHLRAGWTREGLTESEDLLILKHFINIMSSNIRVVWYQLLINPVVLLDKSLMYLLEPLATFPERMESRSKFAISK